MVSPTGSGREATDFMLAIMSSTFPASVFSLRIISGGIFPSESLTSSAFASRIPALWDSRAAAMASRALSFVSDGRAASASAALFASMTSEVRSLMPC